jgi:ribose transport system substrate-binding protein
LEVTFSAITTTNLPRLIDPEVFDSRIRRHNMIRRSAIAVGLAVAFGFAGSAFAQEIYIPLVSKGFQHQFWQAVKSGAEQAAKDYKVKITFEGPESETMVDKQIDMLSAALAKNPKALGFAALDSKAAIPLLKKAQAAHIPVVAFDSGVDSDIPVTTATTDNRAAASLAADKMAELIGKAGEVAVVAHDQTSRTGVDRRDGFLERMKAKYPNVKIVSVQYGGGDHLKSTEITKSILQAYPNLKGIFGTNEGSAIGVANGAKETKRKVVIIGYDSGKQQKDGIRDGSIAGAITQNPVGIGYKTVEAAVKALKGEKLPKVIDTGFYWYDKTNINDPKVAAVLYD